VTDSSDDVATGPGLDSFRGSSRLERAVLPFLREPTLWPVLAGLVAHVVVIVSPMLVIAWQEGQAWSLIGLVVLAVPSALVIGRDLRRSRRLQALSRLVISLWALCGVGAFSAVWLEIL
jgi:hypothetical protein